MKSERTQKLIYDDKITGEIQINYFRIFFLIFASIFLFLLTLNIEYVTITYKIDAVLIFIGILYSLYFIKLLKKKRYYKYLTYFSSVFDISLITFSILMGTHAYNSSYAILGMGFNVFILFPDIIITIRRHNYINTLFTTFLAALSYLITVIVMYEHNVFSTLFISNGLMIRFDIVNELSKVFIIIITGLICAFISYNFDLIFNKGIELEIKKEKISTTNRITSSIIHDIKNSLNVISGFSELIEIKIQNTKKYTSKIQNEVHNLYGSLEEILEYTKNSSEMVISLNKINIDTLKNEIKDTITSISAINKKVNIKIINNLKNSNIILNIDLFKIKRAILNILKNAIEASLSNGKPQIVIKLDKKIKKIKKNRENEFIVISISDNGPGIEEKDQELIFTPFYTKNKKNGTGLGLAITKNIIDHHNGNIYYKSQKGEGTTFFIEIPCSNLT